MYKLILTFNNQVLQEKPVGHWRDYAREKWRSVAAAISPIKGKNLELILYTPEGEIELLWSSDEGGNDE